MSSRFHSPSFITTVAVGVCAGYIVYRWLPSSRHLKCLERKVRKQRQQRARQIEEIHKLTADLDPKTEKQIAALNIDELLEALKTGKFTCLEVLRFYQKRSLRSQEMTNCVTEYILEASETAKKYDALRSKPDYEPPPLFGLPISLKANISFKGRDQFKGYVQDIGCPVEANAMVVQHLQELGAIPFVLTNVPQTLLSYSCENPVYGSTSSPLSLERTSGGSSGGEAALIATGGSLVGIGADTGGSIRIPCSFCGIVGFKPCSRRISHAEMTASAPSPSHVFGSSGPMSIDVRGCVTILRAFWSQTWIHNQDAYVAPVDFNNGMYESTKPLRIGYFDTNGCLEPVPVMKRAVHETREHLEKLGHTLIKFTPPNIERAFQLFILAITLDGGRWILNRWDNDLPVEGYHRMLMPFRWPYWLRSALSVLLRHVNKRAADAIGNFFTTTQELLLIHKEIEAYWMTWKKLMRDLQLDCFICPAFPVPAMRHKEPYLVTFSCSYTGIFNMLDYPAGVVPVTKVTETDIKNLKTYNARDYFERILRDSAKDTLGFPVCVQIISLPYRDEMVLRVMREIETAVQNK